MDPAANGLSTFLPPVRAWFEDAFGPPTPPQAQGWPPIQRGEHTLILAPTGSGKTLAAFLWGIDRLFRVLRSSLGELTQNHVGLGRVDALEVVLGLHFTTVDEQRMTAPERGTHFIEGLLESLGILRLLEIGHRFVLELGRHGSTP